MTHGWARPGGQEDAAEQDWEAVVPYTGPPRTAPVPDWPPPAHPPAYGPPPGYAAPPGGYWPPPRPSRPARPGMTVAAAVLAFVLAALTLFGTVYAMAFSALLAVTRRSAGGLGPWIALVQLGVVGALVAGGLLVLGGRRSWLFAAAAAEVALSVYWVVVLDDAALPGLGGVAAHWRDALGPALEELAGDRLVVDLRSSMYAAFWRPPAALARRVATVRVLHEVAGKRQVVSHFNKATKGRLVRGLLEDGGSPRTPAGLADLLRDLGWKVEDAPGPGGGARLDVVVAEV